jgi:hypothetical protein
VDDLVYLRAPCAMSDNLGNRWPEAGAVVGVPRAQAVVLLAIQDAGLVQVEGPATRAAKPAPEPVEPVEVTEPAPTPAAAVTEPAPKRPRRRTAQG